MAKRGRIDPRLATQVLVLQFAVVAFTLVIAFGLFAVFSHQRIAYEYGVRALDIARVLATAPVVRSGVAGFDEANRPGPLSSEELAKGPLEAIAMDIQRQTDVLFVVITNDRGLRLSPSGRRRARQADEHRARPTRSPGTRKWFTKPERSGPSVRAKVPVVDPNSQRVIGEVSVGISTAAVHQQLWSNIRTSAVLGGVALLLGGAGSILLARRWRLLTLGLRPAEMAELVRGQAAVLHGIGEGVVAADPDWQTTFVNEEACRLLGISDDVGRPVADIGLTPRVLAVFRAVDSHANPGHRRRTHRRGLGPIGRPRRPPPGHRPGGA